jgi:hypothetical protein
MVDRALLPAALLLLAGCAAAPPPGDDDDASADPTPCLADDADCDGVTAEGGDCDDDDPTVYPGRWDDPHDDVDSDCEGHDSAGLQFAFATFSGRDFFSLSGRSTASVGDIDGDGRPEILVGAANEDQSRGHSYLFLSGDVQAGGDFRWQDAHAVLGGETPGSQSGRTVASAGDVDGDGRGDVLIGAHSADDAAGVAYLVLGSALLAGGTIPLADAHASFHGAAPFDHLGAAAASAGDVDGDGRSDVLVGAYGDDAGAEDAGAVGLFLASSLAAGGARRLADADARFLGASAGDALGRTVASLGDIDGDGRADLLLGALGHDAGGADAGAAVVFLGSALAGGGVFGADDARATLVGEEAGDGVGYALAGAGDVDGDGRGDALLSGYRSDRSGPNAGVTYIVFGERLGAGGTIDLRDADVTLLGETRHDNDLSGWSVAGAGDVDGDGLADVLIGAMWNDDGGYNAGKAYLALGRTLAAGGVFPLGRADAAFVGPNTETTEDVPFRHDQSGEGVAAAGDVNGDGFDDLLVGAPDHLGGRGRTYLLLSPFE